MATLPEKYNFTETEKKWQQFWHEKGIYSWSEKESRENTFVVDTPPPTVSGQLHIGHVYSYTQADFIVRFQRMMGKNIFYPIGFDDNGLPTERLVEKQMQVKACKVEKSKFIAMCKEISEVEEEKFRNLFKHIALSVDWNLEYRTINPLSQKISQMSFLDLVEKRQVYRDSQPILWDPVDQTALAQADIEDKEKSSHFNDIVFILDSGEKLVIGTTRPELLGACVAVFYHPDDERYKQLKGKYAITPLFNTKVPIIADDAVQIDKGTGLVMCCTFGDLMDVEWWRKYKLPTKVIIDKHGIITSSISEIHRLRVKDARSKTIELLKAQGLLIKQDEITHTVKCAERSGAPLEIITTKQWFIRTLDHKEALLKRANELNWHPSHMKIRLENWINSLSWDWCISRQRYSGVPFPVWYSKRAGEEGKILYASIDQLPVDPIKDLPKGYTREEVEADIDIMDTWATSSVSPQLSSLAISEKFAVDIDKHKKLFPFDLRPQAHEIIRTWAFYTILKAHLHENILPWHNIMVSGWCLAEDRSKMSKSKGNTVVPENLLATYGSDVVRYWASTSKLGADTVYSEDVLKNGKRLVTKLLNAAKFASQHFELLKVEDKNTKISNITHKICCSFDNWLLVKLTRLVTDIETEMKNYEYASAMHQIEKFFWSDFCDTYLEVIKTRAYNQDNTDVKGQYSAILAMYHSLRILLKLFAPFIPYITEEIYHGIYGDTNSIHMRGSWPQIQNACDQGIKQSEDLITILDFVRKAKAAKNLSVKAPIDVIQISGTTLTEDLMSDLKNVTSTAKIEYIHSDVQDVNVNIIFPA